MPPEMDTPIPKTSGVDIWSLGCIMYRMVTSNPLFDGRLNVWEYVVGAPSPPSVVKNRGLSITCEDFLRDVLQPKSEDRPNAEDCLKTGWIMSGDPRSGSRIGSDIYRRLSKIELEAPDIDSFSHTVTDGEAHEAPARTWSTRDNGNRQVVPAGMSP